MWSGNCNVARPACGARSLTSACMHRSINNTIGAKLTLLLGSFGYALYIGSYL